MYISGTHYDFSSRMHQLALTSLATGTGFAPSGMLDINTFVIEGRGYLADGTVTSQESGKWEREARNLVYRLSGDGSAMYIQMF